MENPDNNSVLQKFILYLNVLLSTLLYFVYFEKDDIYLNIFKTIVKQQLMRMRYHCVTTVCFLVSDNLDFVHTKN